jgi:dipeptidyl aminopeptidase/acylaminoacyl peptidase
MTSARSCALYAALLLTTAVLAADAPTPLPLDLAFARRDAWKQLQPAISPDGRYLAYDVRTPPQHTDNGPGETAELYLPSGFMPSFAGVGLWVSSVETGEARPVCKTGPCWRGSWSPSSRQLAFYSDEEGAPALWLYDLASGSAHHLGPAVVGLRLTSDRPIWSPDGKTIYVLLPPPAQNPDKKQAASPAAAVAGQPTVTVSRTRAASAPATPATAPDADELNKEIREHVVSLAAIDVATGQTRSLVPYDAEPPPYFMRLSPDGRWLSYLSVPQAKDAATGDFYEDLVIVPSTGGKPVATFRDLRLPDREDYDAMYRWTPDSRRIVFAKDDALWIANVDDGEQPRRLAAALGKIASAPLNLTRDGSSAVASLVSADAQVYSSLGEPDRLAVVPLGGGEPHVLAVSGTPIAADANSVWQPTAESIVVLRHIESDAQNEIVEINAVSGKTTRLWVGRGVFTPAGVIAGSNTLVTRFENLTTPGDYFTYDRNLTMVRRLSRAEPRLDAVKSGPMEHFETVIGGYDGKLQTIQSRVFLPYGAKRGDHLPTIAFFYAGYQATLATDGFGGGAPSTVPLLIFTSRGYAVLVCDVPIGPEGKAGNPAQEMTNAVVAQVDHAAELGYTDIRRVAIMGQSYGGYGTAAVITRTNLFRAAMALDGTYDLAGNYSQNSQNEVQWSEGGQGRMGTHPWADLERYIANSPYYQADKIHTPLLLLHGEKDNACPVIEARKMFNALDRLDRKAELAIYAGEGHVLGLWSVPNAVDASQRMLDFLARHFQQP